METSNFTLKSQVINSTINNFFNKLKISRIAYRCGMRKKDGIPISTILLTVFSLSFFKKNSYQFFSQKDTPFKKDALYSLLNSPNISWRLFLHKIALVVISFFSSLSSKNTSVLIIDDSMLERPRTKKAELCSRIYDHVNKIYTKGYRFLCLGWSDGTSFVPVDFAILASRKPKNIICNTTKVLDPRASGAKRRKESIKTAPRLCTQMLKQAKAFGIKASYVLMDSWFSTPAIVTACAEYFPVICMAKKTPKVHYITSDGAQNVKNIFRSLRKRPGKAKWLASTVVTLKTGIEVRLVFVRNRNRPKEWFTLLSTDINLPESEVLRLYGMRWDIEVFFRTIKQHLDFVKIFQGRNFDGIVAYSSVVMLRYTFLSLEQRRTKDPRSLGLLFHACYEELKGISTIESMTRIFGLVYAKLFDKYDNAEMLNDIFKTIINAALEDFGFIDHNDEKNQRLVA